jgi:hypothetical protein
VCCSLAKYCTNWARIWREKCLEIAERSWVFSPQIIAPSGTIFSKAMVNRHATEAERGRCVSVILMTMKNSYLPKRLLMLIAMKNNDSASQKDWVMLIATKNNDSASQKDWVVLIAMKNNDSASH